jgi:transcriptional regulator with XRE-family HTH domain
MASGEEMESVGARIARARVESGLTQAELAEVLDLTPRSVQGYEAAERVPYRHLRAIAAATRTSPTWLLTGNETPASRQELADLAAHEIGRIADRLIDALDDLAHRLDDRFDRLENRIDRLDNRLNNRLDNRG